MRTAVAVMLLVLASSAHAKDFRVLDLGDRCDAILKTEEQLGSVYSGGSDEGPLLAFRGSYQGWPAVIGYSCRDGKFVSGSYLLSLTSLSEAKAFFAELKRTLIQEHGQPTVDAGSPEMRRKLSESSGKEISETETYSCIWNKANMRIALSMNGPFGGEGWQTSVTYTGPI